MKCKQILACVVLAAMTCCGAVAETVTEPVTYDAVYTPSNPIPHIAEVCRPAVVEVRVSKENWDGKSKNGTVDLIGAGSGCYFAADDAQGGYILTNKHVVDDGNVFEVLWLDGTIQTCELVGTDDGTDIAVLHFEAAAPEGVQPIPMGDSDALVIGELVVAIGNPGAGKGKLFATVTAGIVSGLDRDENADNFTRMVKCIQTDAAINSGNSGGALLNAKGELVGVPTLKWIYDYSTVYESIGFCIPSNTIKGVVEQIVKNGKVIRPRLGMMVAALDGPEEAMNSIPPKGVQVTEVENNTPASKAGLQQGDIITEANGERVFDFHALSGILDALEEGDGIELTVYRYYDAKGDLLKKYEVHTFTLVPEIID